MPKALSTKQRAFIEHYLNCWSETEAARRAGYADPNRNAHRLMVNNGIAEAITARLAELKMTADEVLTRLSDHARGSIASFLDTNASGDLRGFKLGSEQPVQIVRRATHTRRTYKDGSKDDSVTIELYDAQVALQLLGKHHGLFVEKIDISHQEIEKFLDTLQNNLSPEEYARIVALAAGGAAAGG